MSFHWSSLTTEGRIEALKTAWEHGASMADIGARLGISRQAVAGIYFRHGHLLEDCPLRSPFGIKRKKRRTKAEIETAKTIEAAALAEQAVAAAQAAIRKAQAITEPHGVGRTLMMLARHQCKWPVNDAERGQEHLFCALPADGPYCDHHKQRSVYIRKEA